MFRNRSIHVVCITGKSAMRGTPQRTFASVASVGTVSRSHRVVVIGGGAAGLNISHQLLRSGRFTQDDIAVIDPATWHDYQPGWTLVGGGLKNKDQLRRRLDSLINPKLKFYNNGVHDFMPSDNYVRLENGDAINYEQLIVTPGIHVNFDSIKGLSEHLNDPSSNVSSTYSYDTCDKVNRAIKRLQKGVALFTQPSGIIKCAGAPQKIMWLALDHWRRAGLYDPSNASNSAVDISFATALPAMFGVAKYSAKLEQLRKQRRVEGLFQHDLVAVDGKTAVFSLPDGNQIKKTFDFLHAVPKMGPYEFVKNSPLADGAGYVDVDERTTRHKAYSNVWSVGDASNLPTSKTTAAVTSQSPVLVRNLLRSMDNKAADAMYDGYTSCPLLTGEGKVLLAEFKYGGEPKETFGKVLGIDQAVPRRAFYYLKKDFFPWVYFNFMVKGAWAGPSGWLPKES